MPEQFTRATERFRVNGVDLNNPLDSLRPGYYPLLENVRSFTDGVLQPRQGLTTISNVVTNKTPVHSVRRLTDPINSNWVRIVGAGDALAYGQNSFTQATYSAGNVIYDGNPLIMIPYRPDQAVSPFMYIAGQDGNSSVGNGYKRQMKINASGTVHQIGIPPPLYPPVASLSAWQYAASAGASLSGIGFENNTGWTVDATVIAALNAVGTRINSTITKILYDSGSTGWCSIAPAAAVDIAALGIGCQVKHTNVGAPFSAQTTLVHGVFPGTNASNTIKIASIIYDSDSAPANTSTFTIQPDKAVQELKPDALVRLNAVSYVRVLSTTLASDGTTSFRGQLAGTTFSVGQTIEVISSYRTYTTTAFVNNDTITESDINVTSGTVAGTGWINNNASFDLSTTGVAAGVGRALQDDDFIHLSLKISNAVEPGTTDPLARITNGRILFNCDAEGTPSYSKNYFYRAFRPSDLVPIASTTPTQSAVDNRNAVIIRRQLDQRRIRNILIQPRFVGSDPPPESDPLLQPGDNPNEPVVSGPSGTQTGTGHGQWSELIFRVGDLKQGRVGTDMSRGLSNINGFRFELTLTAGAAIIVEINSLSVWGTYGLDTSDLGTPYIYRYRYRCSTTGACSNYSPPSFGGVTPLRESVTVATGNNSRSTPEVDKIDFERIGGALTNWTYVGTIGGSTFTDTSTDDAVVANAALSEGDTNYQLWPVRGAPISGTFTTVAGTAAISSTRFDPDLAKGTGIKVQRTDGSFVYTTIRRVIDLSLANSFTVELADSIGAATTSVSYEVPEPLYGGKVLPTLWTWNDRGFACGDPNNPGVLYYSNGNNLDTTQDTFWLEVTSPSEPLTNGCSFNGKNYVWSTERLFEIEQIAPDTFLPIQIPGNKGLVSKYGLAVGERVWYVSRDGIYQTGGGDSISITDETLKPFFVKEGNVGINVNGFYPPDFTAPNNIRLSYYDGYLYFTYKDTNGSLRTLVYTVHAEKPGWWPDTYLDGRGVTYIYGEEGAVFTSQKVSSAVHSLLACGNDATTGKLYQVTGTADGTSPIASHFRTQYFDGQDRRAEKRWGDLILDADPNNTTLNLILYQNNNTSSSLALTPATMTGNGRAQQIVDIASGGDPTTDYSRNISLDVAWSSTTATPQIFLWEPAYTLRPETTDLRSTSWDTAGFEGDKFFQGIEIDADTGGVARTVQIEYDGASTNVGATLTVNHTNRQLVAYSFPAAFIAGTVRLRPTDGANSWKLYNYQWKFQPEPPLGLRWESQQTSFGVDEFLHMKAMYVTVRSTDVVTVTITRTDDSTTQSYTIASTANARKKVYLPLAVTKGKAFSFVFSSPTPFRLYKSDTVVLTKPWASEEQFSNRNVFGAEHGNGAVPI